MSSELIHHEDPERRASSATLEVTLQSDATGIVVLVQGEIDMASVPTLTMCLDHVLADSTVSVVVDLSGVTFLDSSGVAALVRARRRLDGTARTLGVRNPSGPVQKVLSISGLDDLMSDA